MAGAVAERRIRLVGEQSGDKPPLKRVLSGRESPQELFSKALSTFRENGMGMRDMVARMFRDACAADLDKIAKSIECFPGPHQPSFAVNLIVVYEYTRSAECVARIAEKCAALPGSAGESDYESAVFSSHMARVALNLGRDGDEKRVADSIFLLLDVLEHPLFRASAARSLVMFSQVSLRVYTATEFGCALEAFRTLADVAPHEIGDFSGFIRDAGTMDTIIRDECGSKVTKTTLDIVLDASLALAIAARCYPQDLNGILAAIRSRNVAAISQFAEDMVYLVATETS